MWDVGAMASGETGQWKKHIVVKRHFENNRHHGLGGGTWGMSNKNSGGEFLKRNALGSRQWHVLDHLCRGSAYVGWEGYEV